MHLGPPPQVGRFQLETIREHRLTVNAILYELRIICYYEGNAKREKINFICSQIPTIETFALMKAA